jgi:hypothetical protein
MSHLHAIVHSSYPANRFERVLQEVLHVKRRDHAANLEHVAARGKGKAVDAPTKPRMPRKAVSRHLLDVRVAVLASTGSRILMSV